MNQLNDSSSYQRLSMFVRVNALAIFTFSFFRENIIPGHLSAVAELFFYKTYLHVPLLDIPWAPLNSAIHVYFAALAGRLGAILNLINPRWRIGYVLLFAWTFDSLLISFQSVGIPIAGVYFILFLILSLDPPRETNSESVIRRLTGYVGMIYFFSLIAKFNFVYFGGETILGRLSHLSRIWTGEWIHRPLVADMMAWAGGLIQVLAVLVLFPSTRRLGLAAIILFHLTMNTTLMWLTGLSLFALSLPLLYAKTDQLKRYYQALGVAAASMPFLIVGTSIVGRQFFPFYEGYVYDAVSVLPILGLGAYGLCLLKHIEDRPLAFSRIGWLLPLTYFVAAIVFQLPEPFGYRQYSGNKYLFYGALIKLNPRAKASWRSKFTSRWTMRFLWERKSFYNLALFFPFRQMPDQALNYMCSFSPDLRFKRFQSPPLNPFEKELRASIYRRQLIYKDSGFRDCRWLQSKTSAQNAPQTSPFHL